MSRLPKQLTALLVSRASVSICSTPVPIPSFPNSFHALVVTGANFETAIQNMMELGYPREQCMLAMRASFNNPDRAAEYLMNVSAHAHTSLKDQNDISRCRIMGLIMFYVRFVS